MSPWNFVPNCLTDLFYANGFSSPPMGSPAFSGVLTQQMKPWGHSTSLSLTFWHRLIIPLDPIGPIESQDLWAGMWVRVYDSGSRVFHWVIVNDVSPFPYDDGTGTYHIDHMMMLCRPFIGEEPGP